MMLLVMLTVTLYTPDLTVIRPPGDLQLETSRCLLLRRTRSDSFRVPLRNVLLSEDGRRAFARLHESQGDKIRVYDFNQETVADLHLMQTTKPVLGLTFAQLLDRQALGEELIVENTGATLLASADSNSLDVAHHSASFGRDVRELPRGGVTRFDLASPNGRGNKLLFERYYVGPGTLRDRLADRFLVPVEPKGWGVLAFPYSTLQHTKIPDDLLPRGMDGKRSLVLFTHVNQDKRELVGLWSISSDKEVWRFIPEAKGGTTVRIDNVALLSNQRVVFSVASQVEKKGVITQSWRLYAYDYSQDKLLVVGPYSLIGSSNSGNVLLISRSTSNSSSTLLIWPK